MLKVGDLVTLNEKMVKLFGFKDLEVIGVITSILKPMPNHLINQAYIVQWVNDEYKPDTMPHNVLHGFADIEQDIIFYEHELLLLEDYNAGRRKK
mgnify:CR=1 FL=1